MGKWYNCSQSEAQDGYDTAKQRYNNAAYELSQTKSRYESCLKEYSSQRQKLDSASRDKINFQKRIEQIENVIKMLSEGGDINDAVENANSAAKKAEEYLSGSIKCSGINSPSISKTFGCRKVEEDPDSANALAEFKKEKSRLEQSVAEVESQLRAMEEMVDNLRKQVTGLETMQHSAQRTMKMSAYEMSHFKKYL